MLEMMGNDSCKKKAFGKYATFQKLLGKYPSIFFDIILLYKSN